MNKGKDTVKSNIGTLIGEIVSNFTFSHEVYGQKFYQTLIAVKRLSDKFDYIPVLFSEKLIDCNQSFKGERIQLDGHFRSYNSRTDDGEHSKLLLTFYVREFTVLEQSSEIMDSNKLFLEGYICKPPVYRKTPLGRDITDLLVAVNRPYGKTDYIPCICWNKDAVYISSYEHGTHIQLFGRIQSREYMKRLNEMESEVRIAYEVSVTDLAVLEK